MVYENIIKLNNGEKVILTVESNDPKSFFETLIGEKYDPDVHEVSFREIEDGKFEATITKKVLEEEKTLNEIRKEEPRKAPATQVTEEHVINNKFDDGIVYKTTDVEKSERIKRAIEYAKKNIRILKQEKIDVLKKLGITEEEYETVMNNLKRIQEFRDLPHDLDIYKLSDLSGIDAQIAKFFRENKSDTISYEEFIGLLSNISKINNSTLKKHALKDLFRLTIDSEPIINSDINQILVEQVKVTPGIIILLTGKEQDKKDLTEIIDQTIESYSEVTKIEDKIIDLEQTVDKAKTVKDSLVYKPYVETNGQELSTEDFISKLESTGRIFTDESRFSGGHDYLTAQNARSLGKLRMDEKRAKVRSVKPITKQTYEQITEEEFKATLREVGKALIERKAQQNQPEVNAPLSNGVKPLEEDSEMRLSEDGYFEKAELSEASKVEEMIPEHKEEVEAIIAEQQAQIEAAKQVEHSNFIIDEQATKENEYARDNNLTVLKIIGGTIDQVALDVCGKKYMCQFNDFTIDGTKYTSPDQIVEAYEKHREEVKKSKQEQQTQVEVAKAPETVITSASGKESIVMSADGYFASPLQSENIVLKDIVHQQDKKIENLTGKVEEQAQQINSLTQQTEIHQFGENAQSKSLTA